MHRQRAAAQAVLKKGADPDELILTHKNTNISIMRKDMLCLRPSVWLNDEVVNIYMGLLQVPTYCAYVCSVTAGSSPQTSEYWVSLSWNPAMSLSPMSCLLWLVCYGLISTLGLHICLQALAAVGLSKRSSSPMPQKLWVMRPYWSKYGWSWHDDASKHCCIWLRAMHALQSTTIGVTGPKGLLALYMSAMA